MPHARRTSCSTAPASHAGSNHERQAIGALGAGRGGLGAAATGRSPSENAGQAGGAGARAATTDSPARGAARLKSGLAITHASALSQMAWRSAGWRGATRRAAHQATITIAVVCASTLVTNAVSLMRACPSSPRRR
ncbi:MAG: hypothetical protein U1E76_06750 [Planctomycetota bacterium]